MLKNFIKSVHFAAPALLWGVIVVNPSYAEGAEHDLLDLTLEQLLSVEVTSVARKKQSLSGAAAAIQVITSKDIKLAGARNIPEALRLAPGIQVTQIDANKWAVAARGFTGRYSNKLLVLVDGRTIYSPSFSGVYWDVQDTPLDEIDRIEVIRGPGGAAWGANAVNGVINIITKHSLESIGTLTELSYDSQTSRHAVLRHGDRIGDNSSYRAFASFNNMAHNDDRGGLPLADEISIGRVGGRYDLALGGGNSALTIISEAYKGNVGDSLAKSRHTPPYFSRDDSEQDVAGGFVLGRWQLETASGAELTVQSFFDTNRRETELYGDNGRTADVDLQYRFSLLENHDVIVGAGYRRYRYDLTNTQFFMLEPERGADELISGFVQDEWSLLEESLHLVLGVKLEQNKHFSASVDVMPTIRAVWQLDENQSVWAAVTRSIRRPSYSDLSLTISDVGLMLAPGQGRNSTPVPMEYHTTFLDTGESEQVTAYELGYRGQLSARATLDLAVFYNDHTDLAGVVGLDIRCVPGQIRVQLNPGCLLNADYVVAHRFIGNVVDASTYGYELSHQFAVAEWLKLNTVYSFIDVSGTGPIGVKGGLRYGLSAKHNFGLRADMVLGPDVGLSIWPRYIGKRGDFSGELDGYWDLDIRLGWQINSQLTLDITGKHLLSSGRVEHISELDETIPTVIERSVGAALRWRF